MSRPGESDLAIRTRAALLDALTALEAQASSVIVIGAQAVYLRTGGAPVALAESTKDADLALDPRELTLDPLVDAAMLKAGFLLDPEKNQPGAWLTPSGMPVDLMVPDSLAGPGGPQTRGVRLPPQNKRAMRRAKGLEAAVIDHDIVKVAALDPSDPRIIDARVAGPAALVVAKVHKLHERLDRPDRLNDKDAHDVYRILIAIETADLARRFNVLVGDTVCSDVTRDALLMVKELFADGPTATGALMAGRAEYGIGNPEAVALSAAVLAQDLLDAIA